jgi:hypothetical protein
MTPTTLVMPYYINAGMLKAQFEMLRNLPANLRDLIGVVVVDDGSPTAPAVPEDLAGIPLQIYRIDIDIRWNQDAARNIGVRHAENNWVLAYRHRPHGAIEDLGIAPPPRLGPGEGLSILPRLRSGDDSLQDAPELVVHDARYV